MSKALRADLKEAETLAESPGKPENVKCAKESSAVVRVEV